MPKIVQACVNLKPVGKVHQRVTEINSVEKSAEFIFYGKCERPVGKIPTDLIS